MCIQNALWLAGAPKAFHHSSSARPWRRAPSQSRLLASIASIVSCLGARPSKSDDGSSSPPIRLGLPKRDTFRMHCSSSYVIPSGLESEVEKHHQIHHKKLRQADLPRGCPNFETTLHGSSRKTLKTTGKRGILDAVSFLFRSARELQEAQARNRACHCGLLRALL